MKSEQKVKVTVLGNGWTVVTLRKRGRFYTSTLDEVGFTARDLLDEPIREHITAHEDAALGAHDRHVERALHIISVSGH